ncbi:unnamed protein product [Orchesella dallaii]|uniref:Uncharacterized protein n=1 Tax=Orchesella dallaii TaxID=48710 RepID=A0ABP1QLK4_9HEXA
MSNLVNQNKRRDLRKILKNKIESHQNKDDGNPKVLKNLTWCAHVNNVAESVETLEEAVKLEALKCRTKINHFLQLHEKLLEAIALNQILGFNLLLYDTATRKIVNIDYILSSFESNIEQASETKNCEWEEAQCLIEPGCLEKIETLALEDPVGMEKELKLAISKVDGVYDIFKTMKEQWDHRKHGVNDTLNAIIQQTQFTLQENQNNM